MQRSWVIFDLFRARWRRVHPDVGLRVYGEALNVPLSRHAPAGQLVTVITGKASIMLATVTLAVGVTACGDLRAAGERAAGRLELIVCTSPDCREERSRRRRQCTKERWVAVGAS